MQGLSCPRCGCSELPVHYTRKKYEKVVRLRKCANCGSRLLTAERIVAVVNRESENGISDQTQARRKVLD